MTTLDWFRTWESGKDETQFTSMVTNGAFKERKIAGSCQIFSQLLTHGDSFISPFIWYQLVKKIREKKPTAWPFLLQSQPLICNLSSSYSLQHNISYNLTEWPYSSMQLHSLRRTFSGTQLKFWIGLILHMLHYKMACIHSLFRVMTTWLHPKNNPTIIFLLLNMCRHAKHTGLHKKTCYSNSFVTTSFFRIWHRLYLSDINYLLQSVQPLHVVVKCFSRLVSDFRIRAD